MEKVIKHISPLTGTEITFVVSEDLSKLNGKECAPRKLARANETLLRTKDTLPFNVENIKK